MQTCDFKVQNLHFIITFFEENGTDVVNILPQMSRFSVDNDRAKKKQRVLDKLIEFFDKFFSISNNKF